MDRFDPKKLIMWKLRTVSDQNLEVCNFAKKKKKKMENNVDVNTLEMGVSHTQYQNFSTRESKAGLFNLAHGAGNLKFWLHAGNTRFNIHYEEGIRRRIVLPAYFSIYHMQ